MMKFWSKNEYRNIKEQSHLESCSDFAMPVAASSYMSTSGGSPGILG